MIICTIKSTLDHPSNEKKLWNYRAEHINVCVDVFTHGLATETLCFKEKITTNP